MGGDGFRFPALRGGQLDGLPEGLFGFAQTTQYHLHISHGKGAGNYKHLVAQSLHVLHPGVHGPEGGFQIAGGPMGKSQRDGGLGTEVKIVLGDELNGQFGVFHRCRPGCPVFGRYWRGSGQWSLVGTATHPDPSRQPGRARRFAGGFHSPPVRRHPKKPIQAGHITRAGSKRPHRAVSSPSQARRRSGNCVPCPARPLRPGAPPAQNRRPPGRGGRLRPGRSLASYHCAGAQVVFGKFPVDCPRRWRSKSPKRW